MKPNPSWTAWLLPIALAIGPGGGCSSGPNAQVTRVQAEKEQLLATIGSQQKLLQELKSKNQTLAQQLDDAEKEIARGPGSAGLRKFSLRDTDKPNANVIASAPPAAPAEKSSSAVEPSRVENTKLGWKPFRPQADESRLAELAKRHPWLRYDADSRSLVVDAPISFEKDNTSLSLESKQTLDELTKLLKESGGRDLRIVVAGQAAGIGANSVQDGDQKFESARHLGSTRALAVADYLDRHGIASDRLGVTATMAERKTAGDPASSGLKIHLLEPDVPLVGWNNGETIRR